MVGIEVIRTAYFFVPLKMDGIDLNALPSFFNTSNNGWDRNNQTGKLLWSPQKWLV
jgi:hypothetical protein